MIWKQWNHPDGDCYRLLGFWISMCVYFWCLDVIIHILVETGDFAPQKRPAAKHCFLSLFNYTVPQRLRVSKFRTSRTSLGTTKNVCGLRCLHGGWVLGDHFTSETPPRKGRWVTLRDVDGLHENFVAWVCCWTTGRTWLKNDLMSCMVWWSMFIGKSIKLWQRCQQGWGLKLVLNDLL